MQLRDRHVQRRLVRVFQVQKLGRAASPMSMLCKPEIAADAVLDVDDRIADPEFRQVADHRLDVRGALALPAAQATRARGVQLGFGDDRDARRRAARSLRAAGRRRGRSAASDARNASKSALSANGNRYSVKHLRNRFAAAGRIGNDQHAPRCFCSDSLTNASTNARSRLIGSSARRSTASNGSASKPSCVPSPSEIRP